MPKLVLAALTALFVLSGCLGAAATYNLSITTHLVDADNDDRKDIEVLLAFTDGDSRHTRASGPGTLTMERARGDHRAEPLNFSDYGRIPIDIKRDSENWRELGAAVVYVHTIEDHQVDSGYSYRLTVDVDTSDGGAVSGTTTIHYQRR